MWYKHQPERVIKNEHTKLLWDYSIRKCRMIQAQQPGKTKNKNRS